MIRYFERETEQVAKITIALGIVLTILGVGGYFSTDQASVTALIPTFFGVPLIVLGILALNEHRRKHAMHAAVMLGLLGLIGSAVMPLKTLFSGTGIQRPTAFAMQVIMAVLCAIFVGLCIKSFVDARRRRTQGASS